MTTLTEPPVSGLIDRLFAEADALENLRRRERTTLTSEQRTADRSDYRQFYMRMKDQPLPVSPETGKLLYLLARSIQARTIIEFGTSFGISTLHLAAALQGQWRRVSDRQRIRAVKDRPGARRTLLPAVCPIWWKFAKAMRWKHWRSDLPDSIDFVLLDGAKNLYPPILALLEGRLRDGALDRR